MTYSHILQLTINLQYFFSQTQFSSMINGYNRILDLILFKQKCWKLFKNSCVVILDRHHPDLDVEIPRKLTRKPLIPFCLKTCNNLYQLLNIDWISLYLCTDIDAFALELFHNYLYKHKHVSKKGLTKRQYPVWLNVK